MLRIHTSLHNYFSYQGEDTLFHYKFYLIFLFNPILDHIKLSFNTFILF